MLHKIDKGLAAAEVWFMVIGITAMGVIMAMEVFFRLFLSALTWSEELAKYIFVWVVFIGMSYGIGKGLHIRLEILEEKLPVKAVKILSVVCDVLCIVIFAGLFQPSLEYLTFQCTQKAATIPAHMGYVAAVMPVSLVLCIIRMALDIVKLMKGGNAE
ncbi:MAG: TRAP transporter small permease [Lachnospiraceae bacterium]|jgi:TRAP-type C4-dicarboxylate transport system permease small subunit|nr:TRAP transporter small permease [Lachnospiraceae bacterium]MCI9600805.1 TRAP transporter small permease [Lachnospiraceae bacterium]